MIGGVIVAVTAVSAAVLYPKLHLSRVLPGTPALPASIPALPAPKLPPEIDPEHPFAGSPADKYTPGAAGIELPPANAIGRFTAREVGAALKLAQRYLITADLDPTTVIGDSTEKVRALLDPLGPQKDFDQALHAPSTHSPLLWLSRFNPNETALATTTIKVDGKTSYEIRSGHLVVRMNYSIVYAVRRAKSANPEVTRIIVHHIFEFHTYHGMQTTPGTVWFWSRGESYAGARCLIPDDGYLHPVYTSDQTSSGAEDGPISDPYERSESIPKDKTCGRASRI